MESSSHNLITILNSQFLHEVQIAQTKLELEGIQSFIADENITSTIGTAFVEGYKLQIDSSNVEKATIIIEAIS